MFRTITFLFLIYLSFVFGQNDDSIKTNVNFFPDTLSAKNDSVFISDSSLVKAARDSIVPLFQTILSDKNFLISQSEMLKSDYRYTGDYLKLFPFNFTKDLGFIGQPNDIFLYGIGYNGISYLIDGVSFNNRIENSLNLNLIQSEDVDSIEIVPLPRGFLYGPKDNPVSLNFITKDFVLRQPYSRIKYYQGPDRESLFDGSFNALVWRRLTASFDITNRIVDETFRNTEFSIWQVKIKLKYFVSNSLNIIASYNYNDYRIGLNGGVDIDSIKLITDNINSILYDPLQAPVLYPQGELKTLTHFPKLSIMAQPFDWLRSDASVYFQFRRDEMKMSLNSYLEEKVWGINITNKIIYNDFNFQLLIDCEKINNYYNLVFPETTGDNLLEDFDADIFAVGGVFSTKLFNEKLIPSVFFKYSSFSKSLAESNILTIAPSDKSSDKNVKSLGADLKYQFEDNLNFYIGYSIYDVSSDNSPKLFETGAKYSNDFVGADLKYFINEYTNESSSFIHYGNVEGWGLSLKLKYWKLLLESFSSIYNSNGEKILTGVPKLKTQTGLYFNSKLFDDNLDLKTGIVFYYLDDLNTYSPTAELVNVAQANKLDFTLSGEIQKLAMIYFVWENLINNQYFITPYYPMPVRTIRFGVAWEFLN